MIVSKRKCLTLTKKITTKSVLSFTNRLCKKVNDILDIVGDKEKGRQTDFADLDAQTADLPAQTRTGVGAGLTTTKAQD